MSSSKNEPSASNSVLWSLLLPNIYLERIQTNRTIQTAGGDDARAELTQQLDELLNTLSNKFAGVSSEIFAKSKSEQALLLRRWVTSC